MGNFIDLNRRFHKLSDQEVTDPDYLAILSEGRFGSSIEWNEVLEHPRLILLAEAGTGKTRELRERAALLTAQGRYAFFVPLEALFDDKIEEILSPNQTLRFAEWKETSDTAWFFLDAVDELKLKAGNLERAVGRLLKSINGYLHRCRIIVSSRPNDWRPETDRAILEEQLPLIVQDETSEPETYFLSPFRGTSLRSKRPKSSDERRPAWEPIALLPLSVDQVQAYVRHLGLPDPTAFLVEIDRKDAWTFSRRPFDLNDLVLHWRKTNTIGTRMDQHEANIASKLKEDPDKPGNNILSPEMARSGAEHLALTLELTRCRTIRSFEPVAGSDHDDGILDPEVPLPTWTIDQRQSLLRRAIFDPATYGRIRFHHRSVQEYLAARRLFALDKQGAPKRVIKSLLFAERYGERVLIPSMRPIAAWLSLWLPDILQSIIEREPEVLLAHGDPEQLTISARSQLLEAFVQRYGTGGWRGLDVSWDNIQRLAHPDLGAAIRNLWESQPENHDVHDLLVKLILAGEIRSCGDLALEAALAPAFNEYIRIAAIRALVACQSDEPARTIAASIVNEPEIWPPRVIFDAIEDLVPDYMSIEELVSLIRRVPEPKDAVGGFKWHLRQVAKKIENNPTLSAELMDRLADLIWEGRKDEQQPWEIRSRHDALAASLAILCNGLRSALTGRMSPSLGRAIVIAVRFRREHGLDRKDREELRALTGDRDEDRESLFWIDVEMMTQLVGEREAWQRFQNTIEHGPLPDLRQSDRTWLERAIGDGDADRQGVALEGLLWLWNKRGRKTEETEHLERLVAPFPTLMPVLDNYLHPPVRLQQQQLDNHDDRDEDYLEQWRKWRADVLANPANAFAEGRRGATVSTLYHWLAKSDNGSWSAWHREAIRKAFNEDVAKRATEAFAACWRPHRPDLFSERDPDKRNSMSWDWCYGLTGLAAEAEKSGWALHLSEDEAKLAARYALVEMNGFSRFIDDLAAAHEVAVVEVFESELKSQFAMWDQNPHLPVIQDLRQASTTLQAILAPCVLQALEEVVPPAPLGQGSMYTLESALDILIGSNLPAERLSTCIANGFQSAPTGPYALTWLQGLLRIAPEQGVELLRQHLDCVAADSEKDAAASFAYLFGDRRGRLVKTEPERQAHVLGDLVRLAYRYVRREDDQTHDGTFTPDTRDEAQSARNHLLSALIATPGPETCKVLLALAAEKDFAHFPDRLRILARERAADDTEFPAFDREALAALNENRELIRSSEDFFSLMMDRVADLNEFYQNHPFANRRTIASITEEAEMQRTIAAQLEANANGVYVVARENEVADRKRTDIQLFAAAGAQAVIEIKLGNRDYSAADLEHALEFQVAQQYLRSDACRAGCLLITDHGTGKTWSHPETSEKMNFNELIAYLEGRARSLTVENHFKFNIGVIGLRLGDPALVPAQRARAKRNSHAKAAAVK